MKGRNQFSSKEITLLKRILKDKEDALGTKKKLFRDQLRNMGFYITDFDNSHKGFTQEDLDELIKDEIIKVKE